MFTPEDKKRWEEAFARMKDAEEKLKQQRRVFLMGLTNDERIKFLEKLEIESLTNMLAYSLEHEDFEICESVKIAFENKKNKSDTQES